MEAQSGTAKRPLQIYFDPEVVEWLHEQANRFDRKPGYFVRKAVDLYRAEMAALVAGAEGQAKCG